MIIGLDDLVPRNPIVWTRLILGVAQALVHSLCALIRGEDGKHRLFDLACVCRVLDEFDKTGSKALSAQLLLEMDLVQGRPIGPA